MQREECQGLQGRRHEGSDQGWFKDVVPGSGARFRSFTLQGFPSLTPVLPPCLARLRHQEWQRSSKEMRKSPEVAETRGIFPSLSISEAEKAKFGVSGAASQQEFQEETASRCTRGGLDGTSGNISHPK